MRQFGYPVDPPAPHLRGFARALLRAPLAAFVTIAFCVPLACPANAAPSDVKNIEAVLQARVRAFNARDVDGQMKLYADTPGMFVFNVVPPQQYDRRALRDDLVSLYRMFKIAPLLDVRDVKVTAGTGDIAYSTELLHMTGTRVDGKKTDLLLRTTTVFQKVHGKWLIAHEHLSVPVDTETGQAVLHFDAAKPR